LFLKKFNNYFLHKKNKNQTMKKLNYVFALLIIGLFGLSACNEDEVSQPTVQFKFNTVTTTSSIPTGRVAANSLTFTSGTISLEEIEFEAEVDGNDSIEADIDMVVEIDFATGQTTPDISSLQFPAGTYSEVEVELELLYNNTVPGVVIEGTFVDGAGNEHPVKFIYDSDQTFEIEREGVITFSEGASIIAQVTFNPTLWFAGVTSADLEVANRDSEGVIVISENNNPEIYDIVADGLELASEVEIDM
jgi:hypothetical protein